MFDRFRRLWRIDHTLARRLGQSMRDRFLLVEENRRLIAIVDKYERGKFEKTPEGTIDWKMEVERLNRHNMDCHDKLTRALNTLREIETDLLEGVPAPVVARIAHKTLTSINHIG